MRSVTHSWSDTSLWQSSFFLFWRGRFSGGRYYLDQKISQADIRLSEKELQIAKYSELEKEATAISSRVKSIEVLVANQAHFSDLLKDLSEYMPRGTVISSIGLTGDDQKPVKLVVSAVNYDTAVAFRNSISKLDRISAADIQGIEPTPDKPGQYNVTITFGFKKGAAR